MRRCFARWWYRAFLALLAASTSVTVALALLAGPALWVEATCAVLNAGTCFVAASLFRRNQLEFGPDPWSDDDGEES